MKLCTDPCIQISREMIEYLSFQRSKHHLQYMHFYMGNSKKYFDAQGIDVWNAIKLYHSLYILKFALCIVCSEINQTGHVRK